MNKRNPFFGWMRRFVKTLGPGLITGASDDDPSAITTFSQAGARFGLSTLWMALLAYPMLVVIMEMCARIGLATNKGIAGVVKMYYPKPVLYFMVTMSCIAFLLNISADISVMGEAANMLLPAISPLYCSIMITCLLFLIMLKLSYNKLAGVLKLVCLSLLVYIIVPFLSPQNIALIFKNSLLPSFSFKKDFLLMLTGLTGAIISPYLFFWQTSTEVEELENGARPGSGNKRFFIIAMHKDIFTGVFFAVVIMYFIILTSGTILYSNHVHEINTIRDAALALRPLAGKLSFALFSIGIIGTGFLIIPVLSGSISYILSEAFNWKEGFNKSFSEAKEFYIIIVLAMGFGIAMQSLGISSVKALLFTTIVYGIIAPLLIGIIMHICNSKEIMGDYRNKTLSNVIGSIALVLMTFTLIALGYSMLAGR
ncbi:MAG TPA: divalent metal cation transporter [Mucilaginibacter sp.]|jgi:NRAMP (natural resistance-associated macrophage protein)-like metal ion transporter